MITNAGTTGGVSVTPTPGPTISGGVYQYRTPQIMGGLFGPLVNAGGTVVSFTGTPTNTGTLTNQTNTGTLTNQPTGSGNGINLNPVVQPTGATNIGAVGAGSYTGNGSYYGAGPAAAPAAPASPSYTAPSSYSITQSPGFWPVLVAIGIGGIVIFQATKQKT
jgi:hypothetical protein